MSGTYDFRRIISQRIGAHHVLGAENLNQLLKKLALLFIPSENKKGSSNYEE